VRRLDGNFQKVSGFRSRVAFPSFESFDIATIHFLPIYFNRPERHHHALPAGIRTRSARRAILKHAHEFVVNKRSCLPSLKQNQHCKQRFHSFSLPFSKARALLRVVYSKPEGFVA
jgi:hypothetical protein